MKKTKRKNWDNLCHNYNDQCDEDVCWCQYDEGVDKMKTFKIILLFINVVLWFGVFGAIFVGYRLNVVQMGVASFLTGTMFMIWLVESIFDEE